MVVGMPECLMDVCIGAGANEVDFSNPKSLALFVVLVAVGMGFICYVGNKANVSANSPRCLRTPV